MGGPIDEINMQSLFILVTVLSCAPSPNLLHNTNAKYCGLRLNPKSTYGMVQMRREVGEAMHIRTVAY